MNEAPTRYPEFEVYGSPRELGRQLGDAAGEQVRGFCQLALESVNRTVRVTPELAEAVARDSLTFAEQYSPDMVEELRGLAESSGVTLEQLMLLQVRNQFVGGMDHACTALSLHSQATTVGRAMVAQNWDNDPGLDEFTIVLTRRPTGKPALMNVTQAGLISYLGFNDAGIGVCVNTLPAPSRPVGVPHYFTLRGVYEATCLEDAVQAVTRAERAIPANMMMATPQGPANLEITIDDVYVLRDTVALTHTNHCLHPQLVDVNEQFPELIESHPRKLRIDKLVMAGGDPLSLEQVKMALSDHDNYPRSICRHANDDPLHGFMTSVFSIIIEADERQMHVSRGNPCCQPYVTYQLDG
jgi:isopenicillin-N N-acyltransferase-like protein